MPDAKRSTSPPKPPETEPVDPRTALARKYLQEAEAKLAEEEAGRPRARRPTANGFAFSIAPATFLHVVLAAFALTFDFLALVLTYHMLHVNFVVGRVVALSTGLLTAVGPGTAAVWDERSAGDPDLLLEAIGFEETRTYLKTIYEVFDIYRWLYTGTGN